MQEALNNTARHSKSTRAAVRLRFLPEAVVLEVEDEGVGFGNQDKQGMGLVSMRERAEMVQWASGVSRSRWRWGVGPSDGADGPRGSSCLSNRSLSCWLTTTAWYDAASGACSKTPGISVVGEASDGHGRRGGCRETAARRGRDGFRAASMNGAVATRRS